MTTAIDTNALLALLYDDVHADASEDALRRAYREGRLVVPAVVYTELAADGHFEETADLDRFLADFGIDVVAPSREALFRAGEQFRAYVDRRPDGLQCPTCGTEQSVVCEACNEDLGRRQHVAADFLIGGHATVDAESLITFDSGFYGSYFPSLTLSPG